MSDQATAAPAPQPAAKAPAAAPEPSTDIELIGPAVDKLRRSFRSGTTRSLSFRKQQLRQLGRMLEEQETAILDALNADLGKSAHEGWLTEIAVAQGELDHTLDNLHRWVKPDKAHTPLAFQPARCRVVRDPLGVVLIISPWNYPFQLLFGPLIGALAAGNCAVLKPSEVAPHTSALVAELVPKYLDPSVVAVVEGGVPETTALLEQRWDHIFYTGNGFVGRIVMRAAAEHLTPVTLELGGKSPAIIDETADLGVAARRIVWGKFLNAGQTCVAPDYLLVHERVRAEFQDTLVATIDDFFAGDPKSSDDYARIVNERHFDRLTKLLDGCEVVCGGDSDRDERYIAPTVLTDVSPDAPIMQDEIFGPLLPLLPIESIDAAIDFINDRDKPLALYVFTGEKKVHQRVLSETSSGGACVNDCVAHLGVPELPFGGVGPSGMGNYHGYAGFEAFSHHKSVLYKSTLIDPKLRYPPYDDSKKKWARRLV